MADGEFFIEYQPTKKQLMFHETTADEVLFGGAAGGGKSKAIVMDALFRCLKFPMTMRSSFVERIASWKTPLLRKRKRVILSGCTSTTHRDMRWYWLMAV